MSVALPADSFLALVKQSGLIEVEVLRKVVAELKAAGLINGDSAEIANALVERKHLTRWQADKLLQGKHKGFFLGRYRLLKHLGSGGMSSVYLAEHVLMRRRVALKVLPQSKVNDSSFLERFHLEAQAAAALDHRNIVRAYDVDQEGNVHFLVMEYVSGRNLQDIVKESGPLDQVTALEYVRQAANGLCHAHRQGLVHRDIKPGNLLVDDHGTIKILDMGLAKFYTDDEANSLTRKHDETVLGTVDYLSPEQAIDSSKVDPRSDVYCLGGTLFFLLAGRPPFPDGPPTQRLLAHQQKAPPSISADRPGVSREVESLVFKMMAKNPDDRFQTATEIADWIQAWLQQNHPTEWAAVNPDYIPSTGSGTSGSGVAVVPAVAPPTAAKREPDPPVDPAAPLVMQLEDVDDEPTISLAVDSPVKPPSQTNTSNPPGDELEIPPPSPPRKPLGTLPSTFPVLPWNAPPGKPIGDTTDAMPTFVPGADELTVEPDKTLVTEEPVEPVSPGLPAVAKGASGSPAAAKSATSGSSPSGSQPVSPGVVRPATAKPVLAAKVVSGSPAGEKPALVARVVANTRAAEKASAPTPVARHVDPSPAASVDPPAMIHETPPVTDGNLVADIDSEDSPDDGLIPLAEATPPTPTPPTPTPPTPTPEEPMFDFSGAATKPFVPKSPFPTTTVVLPGAAAARTASASRAVKTAAQRRAMQAGAGSLLSRLPKWWPAVAVGLVLLLAGGWWWTSSGGGKSSSKKAITKTPKKKPRPQESDTEEADESGEGSAATESENEPKKKSAGKSVVRIHRPRSEWQVGANAEFKTLSAALADMRKRQDVDVDSKFRVQIAAGTALNERVVIDDGACPGIEIIVTGGEAELNAPGSEPAIEISSIKERLRTVRIEGLKINATGKDVAVRVTGSLVAFRLANVSVSGFTSAGVEAIGVRGDGNKPWTIDRCRFQGTETARGIVFKKGPSELASIQVSRSRFFGPMAAGIRVEESAGYVDLMRNLFHETSSGIELVGEGRDWRVIQFINNTFHKNGSGVAFTHQPAASARGIVFYNNLFLGSSGADIVVQSGYDAAAFQRAMTAPGGAVIRNWTDAQAGSASKPGAVDLFSVEDNRAGVSREELKLAETSDPQSTEFLQPTPASPLSNGGYRTEIAGPEIGAMPPDK